MATTVIPVTKALYLCDDVVADRSSRKVHMLGVFNAVRPPRGAAYPYRLGQLCVFVQLAGGVGEVPTHVEIVSTRDNATVYAAPEQRLRFPGRHTTISVCFRIRSCKFPEAGVYLVELYARDAFLDDCALHLLASEETEP